MFNLDDKNFTLEKEFLFKFLSRTVVDWETSDETYSWGALLQTSPHRAIIDWISFYCTVCKVGKVVAENLGHFIQPSCDTVCKAES